MLSYFPEAGTQENHHAHPLSVGSLNHRLSGRSSAPCLGREPASTPWGVAGRRLARCLRAGMGIPKKEGSLRRSPGGGVGGKGGSGRSLTLARLSVGGWIPKPLDSQITGETRGRLPRAVSSTKRTPRAGQAPPDSVHASLGAAGQAWVRSCGAGLRRSLFWEGGCLRWPQVPRGAVGWVGGWMDATVWVPARRRAAGRLGKGESK